MALKSIAAVMVAPRRIELQEFDLPKIGSDDGLLRVEATGICGSDWSQYLGELAELGASFPIIPGHEILGHIEKVGENASKKWGVKAGDRVIVEALIPCGHCVQCLSGDYRICDAHLCYGVYLTTKVAPSLWGGYSQYLYLHPNSRFHKLSAHVPAAEAVLFVALSNGIRWASQLPGTSIGDTVVIQGPGQQGLGCVIGASEAGAGCIIVTGLTADSKRLALAKELGAHYTVDVQKENLVGSVREVTGGRMADVVIDVSDGSTEPVLASIDLAKKKGTIVLAGLKHNRPTNGLITDKIVAKELTILGAYTHDFRAIEPAIRIIESGKYPLHKLCTHKFALEQADTAVRIVGRDIQGEDAIHVTIVIY